MNDEISGTDWTHAEIKLVVADYFSMLESEISGTPYNKSEHNRALRKLTGRSRGSIEFKHQNISAALTKLALPWIKGYKPRANFQNALIDEIEDYLSQRDLNRLWSTGKEDSKLREVRDVLIGPPPTPAEDDDKDAEAVRRLVRKFDPAERDARNRALGREGEELVLMHERRRLASAGKQQLSSKVEWTSEIYGDGAGYDIRSFNSDGSDRLIEVKTTNGGALTPFYISENERQFSEERPEAFRLIRLHDFSETPTAFELAPPLSDWMKLAPINYRASF